MIADRLQEIIDLARAASPQRWRLGVLAVASALVAAIAAGFGVGPFLAVMVAFPAVLAVVNPGTQLPIAVMVIVIVEWLGSGGSVTSPAVVVLTFGLFVFHTAIALLAVTPHGAGAPPVVLRRWVQRSGVVVAATVGVWAFVVVLEQRAPPPDGFLVVLSLGALAVAAWFARERSLTRE